MGGTWPNLDAQDLEDRARSYLCEVTASFFSQAEIWQWLSASAKDIAQKTLCVRRIVDAVTITSTRNVATDVYKVLHVEYIPATGRPQMLQKIDPLRVGHYPFNGATPQYWYEFGNNIGIDPLPNAVYTLKLYVADLPKMYQIGAPNTLVEADFTASTDQTELPTAWQHLLALYATIGGLVKDNRDGPAQMLMNIYNNELAYLKQNMVDIIPDGKNDMKYS
jgi:hypothetical protein